jgi:poly-gamma-glutamate capsule biosynthesis protein CapA/YwtB (metallophosphatase superfamily)
MKNNFLSIFTILCLCACAERATSLPIISLPPATPNVAASTIMDTPAFSSTATNPPTPTPTYTPTFHIILDAVGDIMLARTVGEQVLAKGPQSVFAGVQSVLDSADIRIGNLECAITERNTPEKKSFPLKAPLQSALALAHAEFDLLSLANNHAMDYGYAGLADTQSVLSQSGIATVGAGSNASAAHAPAMIERNGLHLVFLAYADVMPENSGFDTKTWIASESRPGIAWADPEKIKTDVSAAKLQADLVVVLLHSGYEYNSAVSANQQMEAHAAIDAGAALVVGSHPHLLQRIEIYHGGLIAYSLGNFVFDQHDGIENASIILRVVLDRSGFLSYDYIPVLIENGLPVVTSIENVRGVETLVAPKNP